MYIEFLWPRLLWSPQLYTVSLSLYQHHLRRTSPYKMWQVTRAQKQGHVEQLWLWARKQRICVLAFKNGRSIFQSRVWAFESSLFVQTGVSNVVDGNQGNMRGMQPKPDLAPSKLKPAAQDTAALLRAVLHQCTPPSTEKEPL